MRFVQKVKDGGAEQDDLRDVCRHGHLSLVAIDEVRATSNVI